MISFRFTDKFQNNLREIFQFLRKFLRFLESARGSSWCILMKFWENCKKILNVSRKNMETLLGKSKVIRNGCSYYKEILWSFLEIISIKLRKNYEKILENLKKYRKHFAQTQKKIFRRKFCEILREIFGKTYEKLFGNFK